MLAERMYSINRARGEKRQLTPEEKDGIDVILERNTALQKMDTASLENFFYRAIRTHPDLREHFDSINQANEEMKDVHDGQRRKLSRQGYQTHPQKVALLTIDMLEYLGMEVTPTAVIAALKHDMVEDGKKKGITLRTIENQSGSLIRDIVGALTRHDVDGQPIDHKAAAKKVWEAHKSGVEYARVIKVADRTENLRDQPTVARPPIYEFPLFRSKEFKHSPYGKWYKTKRRTQLVFSHIVARDDPRLVGLLRGAIQRTDREISRRPRQSIRTQKAA